MACDKIQETQLSLTNRATHLCNAMALLNRKAFKTRPSSTCDHSQFGRSIGQTVALVVLGPTKNWETLEPRPLRWSRG